MSNFLLWKMYLHVYCSFWLHSYIGHNSVAFWWWWGL